MLFLVFKVAQHSVERHLVKCHSADSIVCHTTKLLCSLSNFIHFAVECHSAKGFLIRAVLLFVILFSGMVMLGALLFVIHLVGCHSDLDHSNHGHFPRGHFALGHSDTDHSAFHHFALGFLFLVILL